MKLNETQSVLLSMFTENTGKHMLDSGGAYGRNWQRNQSKSYAELASEYKTARGSIRTYKGESTFELEATVNSLTYIENQTNYAKQWDKAFHSIAKKKEYEEDSWMEFMETGFKEFLESQGCVFGEEYGGNSYNGESALSQVIQWQSYSFETKEGKEHNIVAIQIYGGSDVRGGYSTPHIFECDDIPWFSGNSVYVGCGNCGSSFDSENGGYSYYDCLPYELSECGAIDLSYDEDLLEDIVSMNRVVLGSTSSLKFFQEKFEKVPANNNLFLDDKESRGLQSRQLVKQLAEKAKGRVEQYISEWEDEYAPGSNGIIIPIINGVALCPECGQPFYVHG